MKLSQEQVELRDLVRDFLQTNVPSEYLRKRINDGLRSDQAFLDTLAQLGLADAFGADDSTLTFLDLALVASEAGRFLVPEPVVERLFVDSVAKRLLPHSERGPFSVAGSKTAVAPTACCRSLAVDEAGTVSGVITWAYGLEGAGRLLAFVPTADGVRACLVDLSSDSVTVTKTTALDLTAALSSVTLSRARAALLSPESSALLEDCFEVLKACEVSGVCRRVVAMTAEYVKTREQFGVPIGSFQAVQHKLADAYAQSESLEALSRFAAWSVDASPEQRPLTARAAVAQACDVGVYVCESCVQCHGGIGFTWEYDLHLYLRRAKSIQAAFQITEERARVLIERARAA